MKISVGVWCRKIAIYGSDEIIAAGITEAAFAHSAVFSLCVSRFSNVGRGFSSVDKKRKIVFCIHSCEQLFIGTLNDIQPIYKKIKNKKKKKVPVCVARYVQLLNAIIMKKNIVKMSVAAATVLSLPSCLQVSDTVNLKKDGSGTIVEEVYVGEQVSQMMESMAALGGGGEAPDLFSEKSAKERAEKFGKGVTLTKFEEIEKNGNKGARMTFSFTDINTVTIATSDGISGLQQMAPQQADSPEEKPMTFQYKDGVLTMTNPSAKLDEEQKAEAKKAADEMKEKIGGEIPDTDSPEGAQAMAMMKEMTKDMKMSLKINFLDGIAETDATHRSGDTVTLMDVNFGKLMEDENVLKELQGMQMKDPTEMQQKLAKIPGVKVETKESISIKVK